ncbi:accessory factor UbiK family protein [Candidatus Sororendozoicomonas aggregata]|uniref:accessory factor UbiK family protein n=1 Tax=Candidatus Sororendozoicomonas aggregata TaxID=3073239 RepID=UPI002ED09FDC
MIDKAAIIAGIAEKAGQILKGDKSQTREDIERNIKALVTSALSRLDLVNRDEFDTQVAVLRHTREKLDALEKTVAALKAAEAAVTPEAPTAEAVTEASAGDAQSNTEKQV